MGRERSEVRTARDFCVRHVTAMVAPGAAGADLVADAAMVTSELVTNAMRAGAGRITLQLGADDTVLRIGVRDDATGRTVWQPLPHFETVSYEQLRLDVSGRVSIEHHVHDTFVSILHDAGLSAKPRPRSHQHHAAPPARSGRARLGHGR